MSCASPIDAAVLADYWLALLDEREEGAVEEHLFACDGCGERLRGVIAMAEGLRELARSGVLRMTVSEVFLRRAAAEGLRVREYAPPAGGSVACTVTLEDDLLIGRLAADLSGVGRVDVSFFDAEGVELGRLEDVPVGDGRDGVRVHESITQAKAAPSGVMVARLVAPEDGGRVLGEYTFVHTRTIAG